MSSFLGAGLVWLETDVTSPATATAVMSAMADKPRNSPRMGPPLVGRRVSACAAGPRPARTPLYGVIRPTKSSPFSSRHRSRLDDGSRRGLRSRVMRPAARFIAAIPPVFVTVLMLVAVADMLAGVFFPFFLTNDSAFFNFQSNRFFLFEEILCLYHALVSLL